MHVQEVNHEIKNYMCYGCGFVTNSLMKKGEQFFEEQYELLPELYKELLHEVDGLSWMPNTINIPSQGWYLLMVLMLIIGLGLV